MKDQKRIDVYLRSNQEEKIKSDLIQDVGFLSVHDYSGILYKEAKENEFGMTFSRIGRIHFFSENPNRYENLKKNILYSLNQILCDSIGQQNMFKDIVKLVEYISNLDNK